MRSPAVRTPFTFPSELRYLAPVPSGPMQQQRSHRPGRTGMLRRRVLTALALVTALGLVAAACGGDDSDDSSSTTTAAGASVARRSPRPPRRRSPPRWRPRAPRSPRPSTRRPSPRSRTSSPNITMAYGAGGSGKGRQDLADGAGRLRRHRRAHQGRGQGQVQGRRRPLLPDRGRADHRLLQPERRRRAAAQRRHDRQDLPAPDHHLGRRRHRGRQPRRQAAGDTDHGGAPLRRLGHDRELHQVPGGRGPERRGR